MTIRALIFDIGGVLEITPDPTMEGLVERWARRLNIDSDRFSADLEVLSDAGSLGTCTEEEWWRALRRLTGMDQAQSDTFMVDFWAEYLGDLNRDLVEFIAGRRPQYKIAFLSNSFLGARQREEERYHFQKLTDLIIYSHEVSLAKPDPRIYHLTCERIGLSPGETIFIDDHEPNVIAARQAGMHAVVFEDTQQAVAEISDLLTSSGSRN